MTTSYKKAFTYLSAGFLVLAMSFAWLAYETPQKAHAALTDGLIVWYDCEDDGGGNTDDSTATGYDLTANGGATFATGKVGNACSFPGTGADYFGIASAPLIPPDSTEDRTWTFWVNRNSSDTGRDRILGQWLTNKNVMLTFWDSGELNVSGGHGATTDGTFQASTDITDSTWHFVVVTYNGSVDDKFRVYVDGATTPEGTSAAFSALDGNGGDFRLSYVDSNVPPDMEIDSIGIYDRVISSSEITELYNSGSGLDYAGLTGGGGETPTPEPMFISFDWLTAPQITSATWTLAFIPDTQNLSWANPTAYSALVQYLVDEKVKKNIQFVSSSGDIVEQPINNNEWNAAESAFSLLYGVIPHLVTQGNHDYDVKGNQTTPDRDGLSTKFNTHFPISHYQQYNWFVDSWPASTTQNTAAGLVINGEKFLFVNLEPHMRQGALDWADSVIATTTPDKIILTTHHYLDADGQQHDYDDDASGDEYGYCGFSQTGDCHTGEEMFADFVSQHDDMFLVFGSHVPFESEVKVDYVNGKPINQHLFNYQNNSGSNYADAAWVRLYTCDGYTCDATSYNPVLDIYKTGPADEFSFAMSATSTPTSTPSYTPTEEIWYDSDGLGCSRITTLDGVINAETVNCP